VARPDSIVAGYWYSAPENGAPWGTPDVVQLMRLLRVEYLKATPPDTVAR
jgi:hypothetical protein